MPPPKQWLNCEFGDHFLCPMSLCKSASSSSWTMARPQWNDMVFSITIEQPISTHHLSQFDNLTIHFWSCSNKIFPPFIWHFSMDSIDIFHRHWVKEKVVHWVSLIHCLGQCSMEYWSSGIHLKLGHKYGVNVGTSSIYVHTFPYLFIYFHIISTYFHMFSYLFHTWSI